MWMNLSTWNITAAVILLLSAGYSVYAAWRTDLPWKQWRVAALVACRALLLLALAAWCVELRFSFDHASRRVEMVVVADRSPSLSAKGHQDVEQWIAKARQRLGKVSVVDIGDGATPVSPIAESLDEARCLFGGKGEKRILLLSDGRATTGDPISLAGRLKAEDIKVFGVPIEPLANESLIADLAVAPELWRGAPAPVEVSVYASAAGPCRLTLLLDGQQKDERELTLEGGTTTVEMSLTPETDGVHQIEVRGVFAHDALEWNNTAFALVEVPLAPRVLIISEPAAAEQLHNALSASGLATKVYAAKDLPNQFSADCIILDNVAAASLGEERRKALENYVRDGGAIVFAGGQKSFGAGGYLGTALEGVFPVMLTPDKEQPPYALVIVLDNSLSMNEGITSAVGKINLAKEIAIAAMEGLSKDDVLALVSFDSDYHNIVAPTKVGNLEPAKYEVSRINAFGMTNIIGGLTEAAALMQNMDAPYKHILLISDGNETETGTDYSRLLAALNHQHVTLSTIGVGLSPNEKLLNTLAYAGKGRYYAAKSLAEIPAVMLQEAKGMEDPLVVSALLAAKKVQDDPALAGIDWEKLPPLDGYNRTRARTHAWTPLVISAKNEPLLARMRYGRGQSLAFMSSAASPWAKDWIAEKPAEYTAFWRQAVLSVLGRPYRPWTPDVEYQKGQPVLDFGAAPASQSRCEISRLVGGKVATALTPNGAGRLECAGADALLVTAKGKAIQAYSWSRTCGREFGDPAQGIKTMRELCAATGGTLGQGEEAFAPAHARQTVQVTPELWLVTVIVLLIAELLLRRLPAVAAFVRRGGSTQEINREAGTA